MGALGHWGWFALGLVLIAGEVLAAPGTFLLWIGLAALCVGAVETVYVPGWIGELVLFAMFSVVAVLVGLRVYRAGTKDTGKAALNERVESFQGQVFPLDQAIHDGFGRIRIGDSVWRVKGPELPAGRHVKVCGVDGATLIVEAA